MASNLDAVSIQLIQVAANVASIYDNLGISSDTEDHFRAGMKSSKMLGIVSKYLDGFLHNFQLSQGSIYVHRLTVFQMSICSLTRANGGADGNETISRRIIAIELES